MTSPDPGRRGRQSLVVVLVSGIGFSYALHIGGYGTGALVADIVKIQYLKGQRIITVEHVLPCHKGPVKILCPLVYIGLNVGTHQNIKGDRISRSVYLKGPVLRLAAYYRGHHHISYVPGSHIHYWKSNYYRFSVTADRRCPVISGFDVIRGGIDPRIIR